MNEEIKQLENKAIKNRNDKRNRVIAIIGITVFVLFIVSITSIIISENSKKEVQSLSSQNNSNEKKSETQDISKINVPIEKLQERKDNEAILSSNIEKIKVETDKQDVIDGKQKTVIWVQNDSTLIFDGDLFIIAKSKMNNLTLGSDTLFIENLLPSQKTFAIFWSKPSGVIEYEYKWSSASLKESSSENIQQEENASYKLLKEKKESGGTLIPQIEFYLANDRDFDKMYEFVKNKQIDKGIFYHAVFVDNDKYATFSKYPITAMTFEEIQSKHIIATYWYNTMNGNREFSSYEKNSWESVARSRKD